MSSLQTRQSMEKYKYISPIPFKLKYDVSLDELYPPWYLHPALKMVIFRCSEVHVSLPFSEELRKSTSVERWMLERRLLEGRDFSDLRISAGSYLWMIRHFLDRLPSPLFPMQDGDTCHWKTMSLQCLEAVEQTVPWKRSRSDELKDRLACAIHVIPSRNMILLLEMFELFRILALHNTDDQILNKRTILTLAKFFCGTLFRSPWHQEERERTGRSYYPLFTYLTFYWNEISWRLQSMMDAMCISHVCHLGYVKRKQLHLKFDHYMLDKHTQTGTREEEKGVAKEVTSTFIEARLSDWSQLAVNGSDEYYEDYNASAMFENVMNSTVNNSGMPASSDHWNLIQRRDEPSKEGDFDFSQNLIDFSQHVDKSLENLNEMSNCTPWSRDIMSRSMDSDPLYTTANEAINLSIADHETTVTKDVSHVSDLQNIIDNTSKCPSKAAESINTSNIKIEPQHKTIYVHVKHTYHQRRPRRRRLKKARSFTVTAAEPEPAKGGACGCECCTPSHHIHTSSDAWLQDFLSANNNVNRSLIDHRGRMLAARPDGTSNGNLFRGIRKAGSRLLERVVTPTKRKIKTQSEESLISPRRPLKYLSF